MCNLTTHGRLIYTKITAARFSDQYTPSETLSDMQTRISMELIENLNGGLYFGDLEQPSIADFAVFLQVPFGYMVGMQQELSISRVPALNDWPNRVKTHLPANPILVPDYMIVNAL